VLLAVLFCLSAWTVVDRTSADPTAAVAADVTASSIGAAVETLPIDTHPPEARWEALLPHGIGGGSSWSHQLQAADLPGTSSRAPWPAGYRPAAVRHAAQFRPTHLLHTPLLI
jgi:hypothetical protein